MPTDVAARGIEATDVPRAADRAIPLAVGADDYLTNPDALLSREALNASRLNIGLSTHRTSGNA